MHMKIKIECIKELFIEDILPTMEKHGYHFLRSKNSFVHENREWKNECNLRFTDWGDDHVSLRTEYFVTSKKVSRLFSEATLESGCMPTCGVLDVGWAYKYLGIPLEDKPWFEMRIAKLDSIVQKWIVEFESVGLSFFKEMNDYEKLEKVLDIYNVSGCPALSVWTGERILHGICLHYIKTRDRRRTLELFSMYRKKVEGMDYSLIKDQFIRLEQYFRNLPDGLNWKL
ncbi:MULTISPECIES: hypothetical protein [Butyricimonas]|uniref:hypothetical protein n=1 Tax=Butyricimonas TaxID=574697 RepID=UPI001D07D411|nr:MULTISPECIES: hypothetical protein [Butyricimonas]MCB6971071.1 hypothetical protein [Butyricimonas synergistica]MCG4517785.1 hypothetical protein [Butyricimonas sp. DFI.6.44]